MRSVRGRSRRREPTRRRVSRNRFAKRRRTRRRRPTKRRSSRKSRLASLKRMRGGMEAVPIPGPPVPIPGPQPVQPVPIPVQPVQAVPLPVQPVQAVPLPVQPVQLPGPAVQAGDVAQAATVGVAVARPAKTSLKISIDLATLVGFGSPIGRFLKGWPMESFINSVIATFLTGKGVSSKVIKPIVECYLPHCSFSFEGFLHKIPYRLPFHIPRSTHELMSHHYLQLDGEAGPTGRLAFDGDNTESHNIIGFFKLCNEHGSRTYADNDGGHVAGTVKSRKDPATISSPGAKFRFSTFDTSKILWISDIPVADNDEIYTYPGGKTVRRSTNSYSGKDRDELAENEYDALTTEVSDLAFDTIHNSITAHPYGLPPEIIQEFSGISGKKAFASDLSQLIETPTHQTDIFSLTENFTISGECVVWNNSHISLPAASVNIRPQENARDSAIELSQNSIFETNVGRNEKIKAAFSRMFSEDVLSELRTLIGTKLTDLLTKVDPRERYQIINPPATKQDQDWLTGLRKNFFIHLMGVYAKHRGESHGESLARYLNDTQTDEVYEISEAASLDSTEIVNITNEGGGVSAKRHKK